MVRTPDKDKDFFNIVAGVLLGDTLAFVNNLPRLRTSNVDESNKNGFTPKKKSKRKSRIRCHPAETITDADNADDLTLLPNIPTQAESLLHCQEFNERAKWSLPPCYIKKKISTGMRTRIFMSFKKFNDSQEDNPCAVWRKWL